MDYKEILKGIVNIINTSEKCGVGFVNICNYIYENCPDLKESEDERIRKNLITFFKDEYGNNSYFAGIKVKDIIAWLEKQCEKEVDPRRENLEELLAADAIYQMSMNEAMVEEAKSKAINALSELAIGKLLGIDKQSEQKPITNVPRNESDYYLKENQNEQESTADKIQPKFKVGDWVVDNNGKVAIIYDLQKAGYVGHYNDGIDFVCKYNNEHLLHLWTIQDAKEGDVLVSGGVIFIFNKIHGIWLNCHCSLHKDDTFIDGDYDLMNSRYFDAVYPATKEQRDLFFQKMNDAGWKFDFENKELKNNSSGKTY